MSLHLEIEEIELALLKPKCWQMGSTSYLFRTHVVLRKVESQTALKKMSHLHHSKLEEKTNTTKQYIAKNEGLLSEPCTQAWTVTLQEKFRKRWFHWKELIEVCKPEFQKISIISKPQIDLSIVGKMRYIIIINVSDMEVSEMLYSTIHAIKWQGSNWRWFWWQCSFLFIAMANAEVSQCFLGNTSILPPQDF